MRYNYDLYKSLIVIDRRLTKELFLQNAGIKQGRFAENMFSRMYDWIFSEATYLEDAFEKYYTPEYADFREFLYKRYIIPCDFINKILAVKSENENYTIIDVDELGSGDSGFVYLVFENEMDEPYQMYDKVINLLLMK
ncbi:hypothetical protein FACS189413_07210 [Bacteroidia bacterium]|nr:hypothetical protein FACS189413_07210 [Bacteroidia bacterium]